MLYDHAWLLILSPTVVGDSLARLAEPRQGVGAGIPRGEQLQTREAGLKQGEAAGPHRAPYFGPTGRSRGRPPQRDTTYSTGTQ
jgi:hypothetical protein